MKQTNSTRSLWMLALPLLLENVLRNLMGTVNVFMLGNYADQAAAAAGVANQLITVSTVVFGTISSGASVLVNQYLGAGRQRDAAQMSMNALSFGILAGLAVGAVFGGFAPVFLTMMHLEQELFQDAVTYLRGIGGAAVITAATAMISVAFRSRGDTRTPMLIVLLNNVLNTAGSYVVVFRPFEQPLTGVSGIVTVRIISEFVGLVVLSLLLYRSAGLYDLRLRDLVRINFPALGKAVRIGFMCSAEGFSYTLGQVVTTSFVTAFSAAALSAKVYVQNVNLYTYLVGQSIGAASQIYTGHMIGAGKQEEAYHFMWKSWRMMILCNVGCAGALYLFRGPIMGLFTSDPEILEIAGTLLLIDIVTNAVRSLNHSVNAGLASAGYVLVPMFVASTSIWLLNVGLGWLCSVQLGLGVVGLWIGQTADEACRGLIVATLWRSRRWQKKSLIQ